MSSWTVEATSHLIGELILCAVVMTAAVLLIIYCLGFSFSFSISEEPCIFEIIDIAHVDDDSPYSMNYDSRVALWYNPRPPPEDASDAAMKEFWKRLGVHTTEPDRTRYYVKNDMYPTFFKNGQKVEARILTMEAHEFIQTHHTGTQYMTGKGSMWCPNGRIIVDFPNGTFRPGDVVRVEIRDTRTDALISVDTYTA
ncbi:MAG: hypothetical protein PHP59_01980 [Methanofollis sp.]|uniref:hypothetical protein n=1 Tax=Methanofollis sp. TaxID=2052835 RepID=UPI00261F5046|nr:hypothetical protein [Methanofollis sp.]MDD4254124.1 hypothetical protein [Methanofollis sp.]